MNKTSFKLRRIFILVLSVCTILSGCGAGKGKDTAEPVKTVDYDKDPNISRQSKGSIRVGVFRGEDYSYWNDELKAMGHELFLEGMINRYQNRNYPTMEETWAALCATTGMSVRGRLEFVPRHFYTLDQMTDEELEDMLDISDLDLMLTFGTASGRFLTANADRISYEYMVFGASGPVQSGILKSETEATSSKGFAQVDPGETYRAVKAAYDALRFKDIGLVYEDNEDAYIYSGMPALEELAGEYGFKIHVRHVDESIGPEDDERFYKELKTAYDELLPEIDTMFITVSTLKPEMVPELISDLVDAGIATVAQDSEEYCRYGAMMFLLVSDAGEDGQFMATTLRDYCSGVPLTDLNMVYVAEPRLYLNYETIKKTGIRLPMQTYIVADTIYTKEDMP